MQMGDKSKKYKVDTEEKTRAKYARKDETTQGTKDCSLKDTDEIKRNSSARQDEFKFQAADEKEKYNATMQNIRQYKEYIKAQDTKIYNLEKQHIKQFKEYIQAQNKKIHNLEKQLSNFNLNNEEIVNSFKEINEYHTTLQRRMDGIKKEIVKLVETTSALKKSCCEIEKGLELEKEVGKLTNEFNKKQNEIESFVQDKKKQYGELKSTIKHCEQRTTICEAENVQIKKLIDDEGSKFKKEEQLRISLEKELSQLKINYTNLNVEKDLKSEESREIKEKLEQDLSLKINDIQTYELKLEQLTDNLKKINAKIEEHREKVKLLHNSLTDINDKVQFQQDELINLQRDIDKNNEKSEAVRSELLDVEAKIANSINEISSAEKLKFEEDKKIEELGNDSKIQNDKILNLTKEVDKQKSVENENVNKIEDLEKRNKEKEKNNLKLNEEMERKKQLPHSKDIKLEEYLSKINELQLQIKNTDTEHDNLTTQSEKDMSDNIDLENEVGNLKRTAEEDNKKMSELDTENNNLKTKCAQIKGKLNNTKKQIQVNSEKNKSAKADLHNVEQIHGKLKVDLNKCDLELKRISAENVELKKLSSIDSESDAKICELRSELQCLKDESGKLYEKEKMMKELRKKDEMILKLEEKISQSNSLNESIKTIRSDLKEMKDKYKSTNNTLSKKLTNLKKSENELIKNQTEIKDVTLKTDSLRQKIENETQKRIMLQKNIRTSKQNILALKDNIKKKKDNIVQSLVTVPWISDEQLSTNITDDSLQMLCRSKIKTPYSSYDSSEPAPAEEYLSCEERFDKLISHSQEKRLNQNETMENMHMTTNNFKYPGNVKGYKGAKSKK